MNVVFRCDASLHIGSGHVMRCLTLADALKAHGAACHFICREHHGNMIGHIVSQGYPVHPLSHSASTDTELFRPEESNDAPQPAHAAWLGATQQQDIDACVPVLRELNPDWLVVDHYALDRQWETALQPLCRKLMVIDDLADRAHVCDLLLDQNLGREARDYAELVPHNCQVLTGPKYALLRPQFAELREYSLRRRANPRLGHLLVTMGGVDQYNATGQILEALRNCPLPADCRITVVMGAAAPWLAQVQAQAVSMPWPTEVRVNISDMAQCMADSDLAIGAAGSTSWERCCLGLPTLMAVVAENQIGTGEELNRHGAATLIGNPLDKGFSTECATKLSTILRKTARLKEMSRASIEVTDGTGIQIIVGRMV